MADFKIRIPNNMNNQKMPNINVKVPNVPLKVQQNVQPVQVNNQNRPQQQQNQFKGQQMQNRGGQFNMDDKAVSAIVAAAKTNNELSGKLASMVMQSLNVQRFREKVIEEVLKDPELRNKIMLELIRKL